MPRLIHQKLPWIVIAFCTLAVAYLHRQALTTQDNSVQIGEQYAGSQYVLGPKATQMIDDSTLYQYAGMAYIRGEDPATINFEHPPLAKYVFGLSHLLFANSFVLNIVLYGALLTAFYRLLQLFAFPAWFESAAIFYLGLISSLQLHVGRALLDMATLLSVLLFFIALFIEKESWRKYILVAISLGIFSSIKYPFPIAFFLAGLGGLWALMHRSLLKYFATLPLAVVVYLASYTVHFAYQSSLIEFFKFEWFRFRWWTTGRTIPRFIIFHTLFTGSYPAWWDTSAQYLAKESDWNASWPLLFSASTVSSFFNHFTAKNLITIIYCFGLLAIYALSSAVYGRYFLQLIPFWLILIGNAIFHNRRSPT